MRKQNEIALNYKHSKIADNNAESNETTKTALTNKIVHECGQTCELSLLCFNFGSIDSLSHYSIEFIVILERKTKTKLALSL